MSDVIVPDIRQELFSEPILEQNYVPPNGDPSLIYERIVYFVPATRAHFESIVVPVGERSRNGRGGVEYGMSASRYRSLPADERRRAAKESSHSVRNLNNVEAAELVARERMRRKLWADLSDHLFGVQQHNPKEIQAALNLSDEDLQRAERAVREVVELTGTVSDADLEAAERRLQKFQEENTPEDIEDSRFLTQRFKELQKGVQKIKRGRQELQRIKTGNPLLFQTPEDKARLHPQDLKVSKKIFIEPDDSEPAKN